MKCLSVRCAGEKTTIEDQEVRRDSEAAGRAEVEDPFVLFRVLISLNIIVLTYITSQYKVCTRKFVPVQICTVIKPCLYDTESVDCIVLNVHGCVGVSAAVPHTHTSVTPHWPPLHYLATCNIKHVTNTAHHTTTAHEP